MAYSEPIKSFAHIRDYMRELYVYGFKSREEYEELGLLQAERSGREVLYRRTDNEPFPLNAWTELLIWVLSFGPVLEVKAPAELIALVKERIDWQVAHIFIN